MAYFEKIGGVKKFFAFTYSRQEVEIVSFTFTISTIVNVTTVVIPTYEYEQPS